MDRILRGEGAWQEAIAAAMSATPRPIVADPRLMPRDEAGRDSRSRYDRDAFPPARPASTLLLVYPHPDDGLVVPLTVRHADLRTHAGEVSLPGGSVDAGDASPEAAALREAHEEIGVDPAVVALVGSLDEIWIPVSNFELRPFVGTAAARPELHPHTAEVEAIVELPLDRLLHPAALTDEIIEGPGWRVRAGVYRYGGLRIWGATARALAMFAAVLEALPAEGGA